MIDAAAIQAGQRRPIARALNAVEGRLSRRELDPLWALTPKGPLAGLCLGLTGPPGVGKSTLSGRLIQAWRGRGLTVGVLCVDPSSQRTGGALLGDRLRMQLDGGDDGVFVRSLAARDRLGGLAPAAWDAALVMRAAFDRVLIETVGVGQSETEIARLADLTAVVIQPASGDALQFLKAGLMEVFDVLVVNKADLGQVADKAVADLRTALRITDRRDARVHAVSAQDNTGVDRLVASLEEHAQGRGVDLVRRRLEAYRSHRLEEAIAWHGRKALEAAGGSRALKSRLDALPLTLAPSELEARLAAWLDPAP